MAWTTVNETFNQIYEDSKEGQRGTRLYLCVSDTKITDNDDVLAADDGVTSIPSIGASWSVSKSGLEVIRRRVKELDNGKKFFQVQVEYETPSGTGVDGSDDPDPTARPWEITSSTLKTEINVEKTKLSAAGSGVGDIQLGANVSIVNAASDPLEVRGFKRQTILSLSKNYADFSNIHVSITGLDDLKAFEGKLNNASATIADITGAKWTFLIDEINVSNARENEIDYIRVNYRVIYDADVHIEEILNAGLNQIVDDGGAKKRVSCKDGKGKPVTSPALLTAAGAQVAATDPAVAVASGTYIAAIIHEEVAFTNLGLPTTFN